MGLIAMAGALLASCAGQPGGNFVGVNTPEDAGDLPANYKEATEIFIKGQLRDPDSAQIEVGEGTRGTCDIGIYGTFHGWRVPVRYNAKNAYGGYVGYQNIYVWFNGMRVKRVSDSPSFCP
jgi:hypothetical protein